MLERFFRLFTLVILTVLIPSLAQAINYYRYKDDNNVTVLGRSVPPHLVHKGYEVLNQQGRVIEVIEPALTAEEIRVRDAALAEIKRKKEEAEQQAKADRELLRLYSHPNDAVRVLSRKLNDINGVITLKKGKISNIEKVITANQSKAADMERAGQAIPNHILTDIANARDEIAMIESEIELLNNQAESAKGEMMKKIQRLEVLTNKSADLSPIQ